MQRSLALVFLGLSCVAALPIVFLTYEGEDGKARLLDCVSPIPFLGGKQSSLSYRCRPSTKTVESLGVKANELPLFEILDHAEENSAPAAKEDTHFKTSKLVVKSSDAANANTKYEVVSGGRNGKKNQGGCADDEVFVGELDLCMPYSPQQSAPKTATVNEDEKPIIISPDFEITKVGYSQKDCADDEIFNPSIGACMKIDNCFPCDEEKDKDKKKGTKRASSVEEEDDD